MIRISAPKTPISREEASAGFSLLEILIVIGLIGLIMSFMVTNMGGIFRVTLDTSSRQLATTIRTAHDEAVLKGQTYRIAFDIDHNEYWVEVGDRFFLMLSGEQEAEKKKRIEKLSEEEKAKRKEPFSLARQVTKSKLKLPVGVAFTDVLTSRSAEPQKAGIAFAYVFSHGFVEKTLVHLKDKMDRELTLAVNPVTGKSTVYRGYRVEAD